MGNEVRNLADALLALKWADMDVFAEYIASIAVDDNGNSNGEHYIAQALVSWAEGNCSA